MCTWPELYTCITKRKSIKANEARASTLLNQFTYKLEKKEENKKKKSKQNKTTLLDLPNLERKEKETYMTSFRKLTS